MSFRVESIKVGVDSLASDFKGVKQDLKEIRDIAIENGGEILCFLVNWP